MATIVIKSKSATQFTMSVGLLTADYPRHYHARIATGNYIRSEMLSTDKSDLFNPIHFSEIEVDGVVYSSDFEAVTALNDVLYNNGIDDVSNNKLSIVHTIPNIANGQTYTENIFISSLETNTNYTINIIGYNQEGVIVTGTVIDTNTVQIAVQNLSDEVLPQTQININIQEN